MTRTMRRLAVALLTLLVLGTALSYAGSPALARTTAAPVAADGGRPEVGDCHLLTAEETGAEAESKPPVDCSKKHTTRTFLVFDVPKSTKINDLEAVSELVTNRCSPAWRETVGGSLKDRYLATFSYSWFLPTKAERADGARFVRCDLQLIAGDQLAPLPNDNVPALPNGAFPDTIAKCHLGKKQDYWVTVCSRAHSSRSKGVFAMSGKAYPSEKARYNAAAKQCPRFTKKLPWLVFYPTEEQWKAGFKLFLCDAVTKS